MHSISLGVKSISFHLCFFFFLLHSIVIPKQRPSLYNDIFLYNIENNISDILEIVWKFGSLWSMPGLTRHIKYNK